MKHGMLKCMFFLITFNAKALCAQGNTKQLVGFANAKALCAQGNTKHCVLKETQKHYVLKQKKTEVARHHWLQHTFFEKPSWASQTCWWFIGHMVHGHLVVAAVVQLLWLELHTLGILVVRIHPWLATHGTSWLPLSPTHPNTGLLAFGAVDLQVVE